MGVHYPTPHDNPDSAYSHLPDDMLEFFNQRLRGMHPKNLLIPYGDYGDTDSFSLLSTWSTSEGLIRAMMHKYYDNDSFMGSRRDETHGTYAEYHYGEDGSVTAWTEVYLWNDRISHYHDSVYPLQGTSHKIVLPIESADKNVFAAIPYYLECKVADPIGSLDVLTDQPQKLQGAPGLLYLQPLSDKRNILSPPTTVNLTHGEYGPNLPDGTLVLSMVVANGVHLSLSIPMIIKNGHLQYLPDSGIDPRKHLANFGYSDLAKKVDDRGYFNFDLVIPSQVLLPGSPVGLNT